MHENTYMLWDGPMEENTLLTHYSPEQRTSPWTVVIFPGGAYTHRAVHEGAGYAEFLCAHGINAFVVDYRVAPHRFPAPLLDARRAVRLIRNRAAALGADVNKIAVMGSSAGGHLAALTSTYTHPLEGEVQDGIGREDFLPNAQILCYPVIRLTGDIAHAGSGQMLLGEKYDLLAQTLSPDRLVSKSTPPAFIWHTFADDGVSALNSIEYAKALHENQISTELHIFPEGDHGLGLAMGSDDPVLKHVSQWGGLLLKWLETI